MESDNEVESIFRAENEVEDDDEEEEEEEDKAKLRKPPSSYGSMKSDDEEAEEEDEEEGEGERSEEVVMVLPDSTTHEGTGLQMIRSESPETLYTMTTQQTKLPGAVVIDTRSSDLGDFPEDDDDDDDEEEVDESSIINSPEPPEFIEPDDSMQTDENGQPGRLHPESDLPHVFKSMQSVLSSLDKEELYKFKMLFYHWDKKITLSHVMEGDILDFVDKTLEVLGRDQALLQTLRFLEAANNKPKADELQNLCKRLLTRYYMRAHLIRKHEVIHEGVVRAGVHHLLQTVYVEPEISTCGYGGVDPSHELRPHPPLPLQVPSADTFVSVNNLFRIQKDDGTPVRTVLTTGLPGIGMSVSVAKFSLDWAQERANRDLQFVIKLSFKKWWLFRTKVFLRSEKMSIMEVIEYLYPKCKGMTFLEEPNCKFLIIMDSFDCYQASLDWENAPVINDNHTQAHPDVLIVNIIRGTVLRGACIWILGRRAAVSQIPSQFINVVTEIQGFSDEMKDDFLTRRAISPEQAQDIVTHFKRLPALVRLARQPFVSWMVFRVFERCYRYRNYGVHPPRLTPFYINIAVVQMNRRLQFYYGQPENKLDWSSEDKNLLIKMGKMAFQMLEKNSSVFFADDVKEYGLKLMDVTVQSGMCTELPSPAPDGRRRFCFLHFTFQEFMAALYVFTMFRSENRNVLDTGLLHMPTVFASKTQTKSAAGLVQCALARTLNSQLGHYDLFLRFLCGILNVSCHESMLSGFLYHHKSPKVCGLDEAEQLLKQIILTAPKDRVENLKECLREMTQENE